MPDFSKAALSWTLTWDADWVSAVTFVGKSRHIVAGNNLGQMLAWELPNDPKAAPPAPLFRLDGHTNVISRLCSAPVGNAVYSASYDHQIHAWDLTATPQGAEEIVLNARTIEDTTRRKSNGAKVPPPINAKVQRLKPQQAFAGHQEWVTTMALTADGKTLISGDDQGVVHLWDTATRQSMQKFSVKGWVQAVALSPDRSELCISERYPLVFDSGRHAGVKLWNVKTGEMKRDVSADFKGQFIGSAAYHPDGSILAIGRAGELDGTNGTITLLEPNTGKKIRTFTPGHLNGLTDLAFHPDGKHLLSCGRDTMIRVWEIASGKLVAEWGKGRGGQFKDWLHALSISADGLTVVAADMAGSVQVWTLS